MQKRFTRFILAVLLVGLIPAVSNAITVLGHLTQEQTAVPGQNYAGEIVLQNGSNRAEEVVIYQTDYTFQADGATHYDKPGAGDRSNASWITISPKRVLVESNSTLTVYYQVRVPEHLGHSDDNELTANGTFWSLIMIETVPEQPLQTPVTRGQIGIRSVIRYGVQIVTHIGDRGRRQIEFTDTKLYKEENHSLLQVDITNTGDTLLKPQLYVELFDLNGRYINRFESNRTRTYPGTSVRHLLKLDVPRGMYKALIVADCGGEDLFGSQLTLNIE